MAKLHSPMTKHGRRNGSLWPLVAAVALLAATVSGSVAQDAEQPTVVVGSKNFTEQIVVGEMVSLLLEDAGFEVERQLNLGGTNVVHQALLNGEVDTYVEYTGTGLINILGLDVPTAGATPTVGGTPAAAASPVATNVADAVYEIVKSEYQEQFDLVWLQPWGFNNTYILAMRGDQAAELGVETISDLQEIAGDLTFGATHEFVERPDGLPGMTEAYGLEFGDVVGMDPGLTYQALDSGEVDIISAFATDGRIPALGLATLEDDQSFFPPYFAAPVVRQELLDQAPEIADILNQLAGMIDDQTMADLNFQVDEEGEEAQDVARTFLEEQGLLATE